MSARTRNKPIKSDDDLAIKLYGPNPNYRLDYVDPLTGQRCQPRRTDKAEAFALWDETIAYLDAGRQAAPAPARSTSSKRRAAPTVDDLFDLGALVRSLVTLGWEKRWISPGHNPMQGVRYTKGSSRTGPGRRVRPRGGPSRGRSRRTPLRRLRGPRQDHRDLLAPDASPGRRPGRPAPERAGRPPSVRSAPGRPRGRRRRCLHLAPRW